MQTRAPFQPLVSGVDAEPISGRNPFAKDVREAVAIFTRGQSAEHLNTAIARIKLGRTLLRQRRFHEAEAETSAGYGILRGQVNPSVSWLNSARTDLAEIYERLGRLEQADEYRAQLASSAK